MTLNGLFLPITRIRRKRCIPFVLWTRGITISCRIMDIGY
jgi:hypothetical protein